MIKYILKFENDHEFESWLSNSEKFEKLKKKNCLSAFIATQRMSTNQ